MASCAVWVVVRRERGRRGLPTFIFVWSVLAVCAMDLVRRLGSGLEMEVGLRWRRERVIRSNSSDSSGGCGFFRFVVVIWLPLVENES